MSNFTCPQCNQINMDSITGYFKGCSHYPPEETGKYLVHIQNGDIYEYIQAHYNNGWNLNSKYKLSAWEKINGESYSRCNNLKHSIHYSSRKLHVE